MFGVGWGISGYCPGPGIASLAAPSWETWVFVPAVFAGALLYRLIAAPRADEPGLPRTTAVGDPAASER